MTAIAMRTATYAGLRWCTAAVSPPHRRIQASVWALIGIILALGGAGLGLARSRTDKPGYFESEVYTLSAISHRRFATASLGFAGVFAILGAFPILPIFPVFAAYVILAVLYITSFARGAQGEDE